MARDDLPYEREHRLVAFSLASFTAPRCADTGRYAGGGGESGVAAQLVPRGARAARAPRPSGRGAGGNRAWTGGRRSTRQATWWEATWTPASTSCSLQRLSAGARRVSAAAAALADESAGPGRVAYTATVRRAGCRKRRTDAPGPGCLPRASWSSQRQGWQGQGHCWEIATACVSNEVAAVSPRPVPPPPGPAPLLTNVSCASARQRRGSLSELEEVIRAARIG